MRTALVPSARTGRSAPARAFEAALAMNQAMGALPWTARTQHDYAQLLLARDTAGNGRRARELLGAARATYRELHIRPYRLNFTPTSSQTQRAARR